MSCTKARAGSLAHKANDRPRSLGTVFDGCPLPGAHAPLFSVPAGHMSVGLGDRMGELPIGPESVSAQKANTICSYETVVNLL